MAELPRLVASARETRLNRPGADRSMAKRTVPFPRSRRVIVDVGRVTSARPTIHGLFEADVSKIMADLERNRWSLTAYVVATMGRAISDHPEIQALRDWRGRLVVFDDVDVAVSVEIELEGRSFPLTHTVRSAQALSIGDITEELRRIKASPAESPLLQHDRAARVFVSLPGPLRRLALRALYRLPDQQKRIMGTVGVSSVGMFGQGGGFGIGLPVHPVNVLVGGISEVGDQLRLALTLGFDHDVVDGGPATRFAAEFRTMLESGTALADEPSADA